MAKKDSGKESPKASTPPKQDGGKGKQWDNFNKSLDKVIGKRKGDGSNLA